jgi:membrane protein
MIAKFARFKAWGGAHPLIARPRQVLAKHRYSTPLFVLRETLAAFQLHNGFSISASLSFYAMFALIPMTLLIFFMLSHLVISSNYAIIKLAILTSNLVPKFSPRIMLEVYNASRQQAVWGAFGMITLFWVVTPLAGALRSAFYTIVAIVESPSFIRGKVKDVFAVLGMLLLFFLFTMSGLMLEKIIQFLTPLAAHTSLVNTLSSLIFSTLLIAVFYRAFFPVHVAFRHILIGSLVTAGLWMAMRPAFGIFLSFNQSYGTIFGGMKNMFISIGWLYYSFAVFLLGTEVIATLRNKDVLLLRGLFNNAPDDRPTYLRKLMSRFGKEFRRGEYIFHTQDDGHDLYYVVSGEVSIVQDDTQLRLSEAGDYFGEMAFLTETKRVADAVVQSESAEVIVISGDNIQTLLLEEPKITLVFLRQMASRLQKTNIKASA